MKFSKYISCFLLFVCLSAGIQAQRVSPLVDSLKGILPKKAVREKVDLLNQLSRAYWEHSYTIALEYSMQAYQLATDLNYFDGMAESANRIGNVYFFLNDTARSLDYYRKAFEIAQTYGNEKRIAASLNNIGLLYSNLNMFEKANTYFLPSLEILEKLDEKELLAYSLMNLGNSYFRNDDFEHAVLYYGRLVRHREKIGPELDLSYAYELYGDAYRFLVDREKALENHLKAYAIREELGDSMAMGQSIFKIGQILFDQNQLEGARIHFDMAQDMAGNTNNLELLSNLYSHLSRLNEHEGDYEQAFYFQEKHSEMRDSIFSVKSKSKLEELKRIYETEFSKNQAELLIRENEIKEFQITRDASRRNYYILSGLLVIVLSIIIISRFLMKQRLNERLRQQSADLEHANRKLSESEQILQQLNKTKDKFFAIVANDLKNPFNVLMNHTEQLSDNLSTLSPEDISGHVARINHSAKNLFKLLENLLLWSAAQTGSIPYAPENFDLRVFVQKELVTLGKAFSGKNISVSNKIPPGIIVYADLELISRVFRNLLENSITFSMPGGHVIISAVELKNWAEVSIADEGKGMSPEELNRLFALDLENHDHEEKGAGLGLILCKSFIEKHSGYIDVLSEPGRGTTFIFTIPVSQKGKKE